MTSESADHCCLSGPALARNIDPFFPRATMSADFTVDNCPAFRYLTPKLPSQWVAQTGRTSRVST